MTAALGSSRMKQSGSILAFGQLITTVYWGSLINANLAPMGLGKAKKIVFRFHLDLLIVARKDFHASFA